jgi:hypothetical protein
VLGEDPHRVFPVRIVATASVRVGTLKKVIKDEKKPAFDHVPADTLVLWKASIPVDAAFKENVKKVTLRDEEELSAVDNVADVFSDVLARKDLHIVICCPPPNPLQGASIGCVSPPIY